MGGPWWPSGKASAFGPEGPRPETRFHRRSAVHEACCTPNHTQPNVLPLVWHGEGVPAQVSSSSSDRGSKLLGPSQNSTRVASKWDVNKTKPNLIHYMRASCLFGGFSEEAGSHLCFA
ncbi:hypothetical protein AVEN_268557-1 [Araneus ventricosus]|uniref:Uncharacterized protein n=1 Tax=Araneus ventricosus TaxID=182803 RepID=A0A4Y2T5G4_ARAVE|nr:hypothetical protein AVEN_15063-1 [Araneus ventricosus]GBN95852.1 hypothetical protein AVEN_268557-1 [Araneus ventricosus]